MIKNNAESKYESQNLEKEWKYFILYKCIFLNWDNKIEFNIDKNVNVKSMFGGKTVFELKNSWRCHGEVYINKSC